MNDYPQIRTTIMENVIPVTTVIDAPWVSVTSLNGMTGDVIVNPIVNSFAPNTHYAKDSLIVYNQNLYSAKNDFTSGSTFDANDWNMLLKQIASIQQTTTSTEDEGINIITVTLTDGTTSTFQVRNGSRGSTGPQGPQGERGLTGETGPQGEQGLPGADGFSPIATVTKSGSTATISITDKQGTTTATVSDGAQGSPGPANTLSIGTVQSGSTAAATITGTSPNQTLNLTLPKGDTGSAGPANTLTIGTVQSGATADATITGTSPNQTLNLTLPKGDTGAQGPTGPTGPAGPTGATGPAGADGNDGFSPIATVIKNGDTATISITDVNGTTTASVSDGATGPQGPTGPTGATGSTGPAGPSNVLSIGTVTSGTTADATITGTSPSQVLNLTLPKGDTGSTGAKGDPGAGVPIGTIVPFSGELLPDGFLFCNGAAVSRTTYSELFTVIGTRYGAGNGSTTFNLPNLKGRVTVGQDTSDTAFDVVGETGGEKTHTLTVDEMPSHQHGLNSSVGGRGNTSADGSSAGGYKWHDSGQWATGSKGGGQAHNNLQPYLVTTYIIKAKDVAGTIANVSNSYSTSSTDVYSASYINTVVNGTNDLLNLIFPVGSVYQSNNNVSPANFIGGTWSPITPAEKHSSFNIGTKGSGTTTNNDIQVTTTGNPVFLTFDADGNPDSGSKWYRLHIYRDGTELCRRTAQSDGSASHNIAAALTYLDTGATAGTHTYRFQIYVGTGNINFEEDGAVERPNCNIVELGYPTGKYAWKRTS